MPTQAAPRAGGVGAKTQPVPGPLAIAQKECSCLREEALAFEEEGDTPSQRVIKKVFLSGTVLGGHDRRRPASRLRL